MKFTDSHEWVKIEGDVATVGITSFAQKELGEIVYVELPRVGKQMQRGEEAAVLESTKAAADVYAPLSGEVIAINQELQTKIDKIHRSPEEEGWLFQLKLSKKEEEEPYLLTHDQYNNPCQNAK